MILLEAVAFGLLLSLATGGSLRNLESERLRGERLLFTVLPLQIVWPKIAGFAGFSCKISLAVWLLMMVMLIVVLVLNAPRRWVVTVAAVGIALNALVISLNGAMPVSLRSVSEIGGSRADAVATMRDNCLHEVLDGGTRLASLGDVIAVPGPEWQRSVVSGGDLLLALGLGGWIFVGCRGRLT